MILAGSASGVSGVSGATAGGLAIRGMYRSTDTGATWTRVYPPAGATLRISRILQDPNVATRFWAATAAIAAGDPGLIVSNDSGATWTQVDDGVGAHPPHVNIANASAAFRVSTSR